MPIRTNRGRAAVYRRLWGWPLRSPRHLAASIIIFVVVVVALGVIIPRVLDRKPATPTVAGQSSSQQPNQVGQLPSSGASLPTKAPAPSNSAKAAPPAADAQVTAELWAETWIKPPPNNDVNQWLKELEEYTTPEFLAQMATIDPRNVPDKLTDKVVAVSSTTSSVDFEVPTDLGKVRITLVKSPGGKWLVNSYTKAD
ncbi:hypothetical protein C8D88_1011889 [Lentzea atacamensis]|uniref:Uncharacterized protein n=2 Tax=Lentzea TaxID=165301 RepID=A0A316IMZ8_9PSEU|nr:hypothetical protein [Lentzea atacamensis]PWK91848.1 hypothetical protein C8D88_1011889 [Lentzea atacamensis]RAS59022.1 hypothetical protein C8D87_11677 [Lentzea atacamensis]